MAITSGKVTANVFNTVTNAAGSDAAQNLDQRRLYNFSDRIAELAPEESPFFVYLAKTAKLPTDDSVFRYLEDRSKIDYTSREFLIQGSPTSATVAGTNYNFVVDTPGGASVDWLIKGMIFAVRTTGSGDAVGYGNSIFRIESTPVDGGSDTSFTGRCISVSESSNGGDTVANNDKCQVIGSAFAEGTGSPDVWSSSLDDGFGYTQIFKTAAEVTNTAYATRMRGYANEFERVLALKLREHKVDIERAMLFNQKARQNGINYTEGIVGQILKNCSWVTANGTDLSYTTKKSYARSITQAELTYDRLLGDLEVIFDPARGGASEKLCMASLPVVSLFNKMGDGFFVDKSTESSQINYNIEKSEGSFGHKIMQVNTVHGDLYIVKQPLFRGHSSGLMLMADMSKLYYRPLVGNGVNRDTQVQTNVQAADEDLRKDMILTEAGLEVCLPEAHALYNVEAT